MPTSRRTTVMRVLLGVLGAVLALAVTTGDAQESAAPSAGEARCAPKAALYESATGFKLWVVRRGIISLTNPLRPLSNAAPLVVLEVDIAGRRATAYGPDFTSLVRGGAPEQLEQGNDSPIRWEAIPGALPTTLQIVAEDTSQVLAALSFKECGVPPQPQRRDPPRTKEPAPSARPRPRSDSPLSPGLPQGAIPGLELQRQ